jgi:hypothetical protein
VPRPGGGKIKLYPDSHVCITSAMDVTFWSPDPAAWESGKEAGASLSGVLQRTLEDFYTELSGIHYQNLEVFLPSRERDDPNCTKAKDINIHIEYKRSEIGRPFLFVYSISQGTMNLAGREERDIDAERVEGRHPYFEVSGGMSSIIALDIKERAIIFEQIIERAS